ncbi:hypothetical protein [Planotetraspora sp. GP83]|uniref:hypothetical protein n=1 Tax=Planotetraspora sp. GP83 TaxID=3156264 RepID=UPI00351839FD
MVEFATRSAPAGLHARVSRRHLVWGSALSTIGIVVMALTAWSTHEDQHYDDFGSALTVLAAVMGGALFLFGLGPFPSWLLGILGRCAVRLPLPMRLAARDVAGNRARTAPAVAATMVATALAVAVMIIAVAITAQNRAEYQPQARPGTLMVRGFSAEEVAAVRTAVQQELPGVPIAQIDRQRENGHFSLDVGNVELPDLEMVAPAGLIGDQALLRYLTGDPSTPYDENTAVVVTSDDVEADKVTIYYDFDSTRNDESLLTKSVPAIVAKPADPHVKELFLPAKVMRDLGYNLEPEGLIIDPSIHRTTLIEQERLDRRLGDTATTYVERGFQASTGWRLFVVAAVVVALGSALAVTGRVGGSRSGRVLLRVSGGSTAILRLFAACRVGFGAACGTALGAAAGCAIGLLLAWPMTASIEWDAVPRVAFDTPWPLISALVIGLPVLAAAVAGLALPGMTARVASSDGPRGSQ